jgi:MFS family permease
VADPRATGAAGAAGATSATGGAGATRDPARPGLSPAFLTLFLLSTGMTTLAIAGTMPVLPLLQAHFAALGNAAMLSRATITIGSIGIVVGAPLTAWAAARCGRKPLLIGSSLVFALAGCSGYVIDNLPLIVASRFLVGLSAALATTLIVTIVAESYDEAGRHRWMGIMVGIGTLISMALFPIAGVLGDLGWRDALLLNLLGVPVAVLGWFGYHTARSSAGRAGSAGSIAHAGAAPSSPGSPVKASAPLRLDLMVLGLCTGIAVAAQSIFAPYKLNAIGVHSAAMIGAAMMPMMLLAALVSPLYGWLRRRASAALTFGLGFGGLAIGLGLFVAAPTWPFALCGYGLFGGALGITMSNLYAVGSQSDNAAHHGANLGQTLAAYYAAPLLAQLLLEPLVGSQPTLGLIYLTAFCGVMCVASFAAMLRSPARPATRAA